MFGSMLNVFAYRTLHLVILDEVIYHGNALTVAYQTSHQVCSSLPPSMYPPLTPPDRPPQHHHVALPPVPVQAILARHLPNPHLVNKLTIYVYKSSECLKLTFKVFSPKGKSFGA